MYIYIYKLYIDTMYFKMVTLSKRFNSYLKKI